MLIQSFQCRTFFFRIVQDLPDDRDLHAQLAIDADLPQSLQILLAEDPIPAFILFRLQQPLLFIMFDCPNAHLRLSGRLFDVHPHPTFRFQHTPIPCVQVKDRCTFSIGLLYRTGV